MDEFFFYMGRPLSHSKNVKTNAIEILKCYMTHDSGVDPNGRISSVNIQMTPTLGEWVAGEFSGIQKAERKKEGKSVTAMGS